MINRYIPVAIYIVGLYRYNTKFPYKTIEVLSDNYNRALSDGYRTLRPTIVERIDITEVNANPDHLISMDKIHGPYQYLREINESQ